MSPLGHVLTGLYNSVPLNKCDSNDLIFTVKDVSKAIKLLNGNKHDSEQKLWSNHLIYGPNELSVHVSMLLSSCMVHGFMPSNLLKTTIISIVKNTQGDICNSDN